MRKPMILSLAALCLAGMATMAVAADKPAAKTHHTMGQKVVGEVTAVDAAAKTVTIKESGKDMTFTIADDAKVMVHGKAGAVSDLKANDNVTIRHMMKDGKDTASEIWVAKPAAAKTPKAAKPAKG